jgi:hypothetical protein
MPTENLDHAELAEIASENGFRLKVSRDLAARVRHLGSHWLRRLEVDAALMDTVRIASV